MIISQYMDVVLRNFEEKDIPLKVEWINNPENNKFLHYDLPMKVDKTIKWFREKDNSKRLDCMIEYNGISVGVIGLLQIDKINSKAEYYITIGDTSFKGKGIATKATKAILDYGFNVLKLHKIYLTVDSRNEIAIKLYEKSGFKLEGYFVDDLFCDRNLEFIDRERYAILKNTSQNGGGVKLYFEILKEKRDATKIQILENVVEDNLLFIKREDFFPFSFGGNKARKGMLFWQDIKKQNADYIVTYGSSSSNHCRIIANIAVSEGIPCCIISPKEIDCETFNKRLMEKFGAKIIYSEIEKVHDTIEDTLETLRKEGYNPYFIQGGGHGNIGTKAYVECFEEIKEYEKENGIKFDYIFHASGTGTTQAGLICGKILEKDTQKIVGISIARKNPYGGNVVEKSVKDFLGEYYSEEIIKENTIFVDDYLMGGYGKTSSAIIEVIDEMMKKYGLPLDRTYTGKAFYGMREYILKSNLKGKKILFIHTGGTPLYFDDLRRD